MVDFLDSDATEHRREEGAEKTCLGGDISKLVFSVGEVKSVAKDIKLSWCCQVVEMQ